MACRTYMGAFLLGSALLVSTGCRGKSFFLWPSDKDKETDHVEVVTGDGGSAASRPVVVPDEARYPFVQDAATGGFPETSGQQENRPLGRQVPELPNILFGFDQYDLGPEAAPVLARAAAYLKENPEVRVLLRGHTDSQGTDEYNITLGSRRAQSVRDALIKLGVEGTRLETVSFGRAMPIIIEASVEAQAPNRRVELFLYEVE